MKNPKIRHTSYLNDIATGLTASTLMEGLKFPPPNFPVNGNVDTWNIYLNKKPHDSK